MLKNIDAIITAPLLGVLKEMGHGDEIVLVDTNFPAASVGSRVIHMPGLDATRVLAAIVSLMPLDSYVEQPTAVMRPGPEADASAIFREFTQTCEAAEGRPIGMEQVERFAFYERARKAYAVVQTGERRLYGNIILVKGIIPPQG